MKKLAHPPVSAGRGASVYEENVNLNVQEHTVPTGSLSTWEIASDFERIS
ncbi:hypothetical protein KSC_024890 [Ktedonobacter sp. SOSP1-52]|nr:hypothetical protein KSC_024890 [Ktedonobacter sp. SOSP1-52]